MLRYSLLQQTWFKPVLGMFLMGLLSGCITLDCKDCGKDCGPIMGFDENGNQVVLQDAPCKERNYSNPALGSFCLQPGMPGCDINNPSAVCTNVTLPNGQKDCRCQ